MSTNKSKFTFYLDRDVECVLSTIAVNYGLSRSKLLEFMILTAGYNVYGDKGLETAWNLLFKPFSLERFTTKYDETNLTDVLISTDDIEEAYNFGKVN